MTTMIVSSHNYFFGMSMWNWVVGQKTSVNGIHILKKLCVLVGSHS